MEMDFSKIVGFGNGVFLLSLLLRIQKGHISTSVGLVFEITFASSRGGGGIFSRSTPLGLFSRFYGMSYEQTTTVTITPFLHLQWSSFVGIPVRYYCTIVYHVS